MHPSQRLPHITPIAEPLYVVTAIDNPEMFASRYRHYQTWEKHVTDGGAIPITVEAAMGNRNFEVTDASNPNHIQLRAKTELWRKENLQNIGVSRLPHGWKYVALMDADMVSTRPDWAQATKLALERYDVVQMYSAYSFMKSDHTVSSLNRGLVFAAQQKLQPGSAAPPAGYSAAPGAPGGAWAYTNAAFEKLGGMLDTPILGSADWYMSHALLGGSVLREEEAGKYSPQYVASIQAWEAKAAAIHGNVGYIQNHMVHYWHGSYNARGYTWRWKILSTWKFDPTTDVTRGVNGLLELAGNKPGMRDEIRAYMASRQEDALT